MKKRITSLIVSAVMLMTVFPAANLSISAADKDPNFDGSGTAADPFQIQTAYDLKHLAEVMNNPDFYNEYYNKYYIQTADIDLGNEPFTPVGTWESYIYAFAGEYNGNYHSISNLIVNYDGGFVGLFGRIGLGGAKHTDYCSVKNLSVFGNIETENNALVGGIVGEIGYGASVQNCSFTGTIKAENAARTGGISGQIFSGGRIESCYVNASINCKATTGGIAGGLDVGANKNVGSTDAVIGNSYFYGSVSGEQTGGIAGRMIIGTENTSCSIITENNYYIDTVTGAIDGKSFDGCSKLSSKFLKEAAELLGNPFVTNNRTDDFNNGYPIFEWQIIPYQFKGSGTKDDPYQISSKEELEQMRDLVNNQFFSSDYKNKCYVQTADINLKDENWTPIGTFCIDGKNNSYATFCGIYDGNHHTISNLFVDKKDRYAGLFGRLGENNRGVIRNLLVYGSVNSESKFVGGICGEISFGSIIENCAYIGTVKGDSFVGGLTGKVYQSGEIINCYSTGLVEGTENIGGIVGLIEENSLDVSIDSCYHVGEIKTDSKNSGSIVGLCRLDEEKPSNVTIKNCYSLKNDASTVMNGNSTICDITTLSESMLKKAAPELGSAFTTAPSNDFNNGYPIFVWQSSAVLLNWLLVKPNADLTDWKAMDYNKDGVINAVDLSLMKRGIMTD